MLRLSIFTITLIILCKLSNVFGQIDETEEQILERIFRNYSNAVRPPTRGPTDVTVNLYLRSVEPIDDFKREYSIQVTLRQEWKDERLKFRPSNAVRKGYLSQQSTSKLWIPDLFIRNEKKGYLHSIIYPNLFVRIFPDGNILFSIRVSLTMPCGMKLRTFPFDSQNCTMQMASYGMSTDDILYRWKNIDPVQVSPDLNTTLARFSFQKWETGTCDTKTMTGLYSCLRLDLLFKRHFPYYLVQVYIPCTSLAIVAWLSFWIDSNQIIARVFLTVTTYLIMMIATGILNYNLPKTSHTKAVDVWTGTCLTFVFVTVVQTIIVNFCAGSSAGNAGESKRFKNRNCAEKLDVVFRGLYPALFALFVCIYFAVYAR
jgi:cation transporter family protein